MRASTPKAVSEPKTPGTGPAFRLPFDNSFFRYMQGFYVPWKPEPSPAPAWVQFNDALALELGLELDSRYRPCSLAGQIPRLREVCA